MAACLSWSHERRKRSGCLSRVMTQWTSTMSMPDCGQASSKRRSITATRCYYDEAAAGQARTLATCVQHGRSSELVATAEGILAGLPPPSRRPSWRSWATRGWLTRSSLDQVERSPDRAPCPYPSRARPTDTGRSARRTTRRTGREATTILCRGPHAPRGLLVGVLADSRRQAVRINAVALDETRGRPRTGSLADGFEHIVRTVDEEDIDLRGNVPP